MFFYVLKSPPKSGGSLGVMPLLTSRWRRATRSPPERSVIDRRRANFRRRDKQTAEMLCWYTFFTSLRETLGSKDELVRGSNEGVSYRLSGPVRQREPPRASLLSVALSQRWWAASKLTCPSYFRVVFMISYFQITWRDWKDLCWRGNCSSGKFRLIANETESLAAAAPNLCEQNYNARVIKPHIYIQNNISSCKIF